MDSPSLYHCATTTHLFDRLSFLILICCEKNKIGYSLLFDVNNLTIKVIHVNHIIFWDVIFKFELLLLHNLFSKLLAHCHIIVQQHVFLMHYYSLLSFVSKTVSGSCPSREIVPMHVVQINILIVQEQKQLSNYSVPNYQNQYNN
jgi:hypothetical protein